MGVNQHVDDHTFTGSIPQFYSRFLPLCWMIADFDATFTYVKGVTKSACGSDYAKRFFS